MRRSAAAGATGVVVAVVTGLLIEGALVTGHVPTPSAPLPFIGADSPTSRPSVLVVPTHLRRPQFQPGIAFPQWGANAYGPSDRNWAIGLHEIIQQTQARWIEMPVNLYQPAFAGTTILAPPKYAPTPANVTAGIRLARSLGLHVFVVPLLTVGGRFPWSGSIPLGTATHQRAWFESWWKAFRPYAVAAARGGADQLSIGTEFARLEAASPSLWRLLIDRVHGVFPGAITYDVDHSTIARPPRPWMYDPNLSTLGVSEWVPLQDSPAPMTQQEAGALWAARVKTVIDGLASELGKPVVISEIGYRATSDCFVHPSAWTSTAPKDPGCQARGYEAALSNVIPDPRIAGVFVWAWSVPFFQPNWLPGADVLRRWYTSPLG